MRKTNNSDLFPTKASKMDALPITKNEGDKMKKFAKILFAIDFSRCCREIVPYAIDFAKRFDARIYLLYVARDMSYLTVVNMPYSVLTDFTEQVVVVAEKNMDKFRDDFFADHPNCEAKVVIGDAAEEILKFSEENGIDLIVMGTHGRKGLDRIILGSVADHIVKNSPAPVITINPFRS